MSNVANPVSSIFEGALNTRDLGGIATEDGRRVRPGVIFRSDALVTLTETDLERLAQLGLRTVVDLRTRGEIERLGENAVLEGTQVYKWSLIDESGDTLAAALTLAFEENSPHKVEQLLGGGAAEEMLAQSAMRFAHAEVPRGYFGRMLRLLAAEEVPLLFNCRAGKDRTGFMAAVILRTLGVSEAGVIDDYVASNRYLAPRMTELLASFTSGGISEDLVRPLLEQRAEVMTAFFAEVDASYGSWTGFLSQGLGVDDGLVTTLREAYLVTE